MKKDNDMTTERKAMVAIVALCIFTFCASLIAMAFYINILVGFASLCFVSWWVGSSIVETLKETKE